jgi:tetratricopeptide (TPR) repeat protein
MAQTSTLLIRFFAQPWYLEPPRKSGKILRTPCQVLASNRQGTGLFLMRREAMKRILGTMGLMLEVALIGVFAFALNIDELLSGPPGGDEKEKKLNDIVKSSDLIVVGKVTGIERMGPKRRPMPGGATFLEATVEVEKVLRGKYEKKILLVEYTRQAGLSPQYTPKPMKKGTFILFLKKLDEKKVEHYKNMSKSPHKDKAEFYKRTDNVHYASFEASDENIRKIKTLLPKKVVDPKAHGHYLKAMEFEKNGLVEKAIEKYKKALAIQENAGWWWCLGNCYVRLGKEKQIGKAIKAFEKAILSDPDYPLPYSSLASIAEKKGLYNTAIGYLEKYVELNQHKRTNERVKKHIEELKKKAKPEDPKLKGIDIKKIDDLLKKPKSNRKDAGKKKARILREIVKYAGGTIRPYKSEKPARIVIKGKEDWEKYKKEFSIMGKLPKVDFKKEMIVYVSMGTRPSGGYSVEIKKIYEKDGKIKVIFKESYPGRGLTTDVMTYPHHMVVIEKSDKPVEFVNEKDLKKN